MITSGQRRACRPQWSDMARPQPTPASRIGPRHAPPLVVANRSGACTTSLQSPGRPQDELTGAHLSAHPGVPATDVSDNPGGARTASTTIQRPSIAAWVSDGPSHRR
jgi:hypothetical protein